MKNIMSYLIVIFSLLSFQFAQAQSCESGQVKLSDLKFLGESYTKVFESTKKKQIKCHAVSVKPSTGRKATSACGNSGVVVNPGNPQYTGDTTDPGNTLLDNTLGYFFCVNASGSLKRDLCTYMKSQLSGEMDVTWSTVTNSDGDCVCKKKGASEKAYVSCPATVEQFKTDNQTGCNFKNATLDKDTNVCVCIHDTKIEPKKENDCPTEPEKKQTATVNDADFDECFAEIKEAKNACSQKSQDAINNCSKEAPEVNKNVKEAQRVLDIGLSALLAKNANTGALEACTNMSLAGTGAISALSLLKQNCKKELDACKQGCDNIKAYSKEDTGKIVEACKEKFKNATPAKTWTPEHEVRFAALAEEYKKGADAAEKLCKGDAQIANNELEDVLNRLGSSVQQADICKCQLTTGNTGDVCDSVVTPLSCMQNMNQPGCSFSSVGCAPGSTAANCRPTVTQINPNGSGLKAPPSGFAGPGFGSAGGGTAGGKVQIGNDDLSGLYDETRPTGSGTATADGGSPFGVAAGGGSPGASLNMGGGDGAGNGANGEGSEKGGLSGFFQNAKGAISSMFGGGSGDKGAAAKAPNSKAYKNDVNGFRPKAPALRGMANAGEFGGKNRDIWKIMNQRYNDQYHTFITVETPSK